MKTKTLLKSRRGISPILATLLLIVIAVAAIVVTYAWIMIYMHGAGQRAGVMIEIENVYFHNSKNVTVTVRNTGTSDTNLVSIYMGESMYNLQRIWEGSKPLAAKTYVTVEIALNQNWTSHKTYYFKAVAEGGQETPIEPYTAP
ncbi:MAG: archaellin/type IV pilin N-terminal domain-containing protein [Candidatus Bathyarchaeia archaeon]